MGEKSKRGYYCVKFFQLLFCDLQTTHSLDTLWDSGEEFACS